MVMTMYENFDTWEASLCHWGIPKMKWGVRRYQNPDGSWTAEGLERRRQRENKNAERQARKAAQKERRKKVSAMTDEELQRRIARVKLEKEYKDLIKSTPAVGAIAKGAAFVERWMEHNEKKQAAILEEKKLETQYRIALEQTKQENAKAKSQESLAKQTENSARKEKAIAKQYGSSAKKYEAKAQYKRAKGSIIWLGKQLRDSGKNRALIEKMYNNASDPTKEKLAETFFANPSNFPIGAGGQGGNGNEKKKKK